MDEEESPAYTSQLIPKGFRDLVEKSRKKQSQLKRQGNRFAATFLLLLCATLFALIVGSEAPFQVTLEFAERFWPPIPDGTVEPIVGLVGGAAFAMGAFYASFSIPCYQDPDRPGNEIPLGRRRFLLTMCFCTFIFFAAIWLVPSEQIRSELTSLLFFTAFVVGGGFLTWCITSSSR